MERTYEEWLEKVRKSSREDGITLANVPEALKTAELCMEAVKHNGRALELVPEALLTEEICAVAVSDTCPANSYGDTYGGNALRRVPDAMKTESFFVQVVSHNGLALENVPEIEKSHDVCLAAVRQNGNALRRVPFENQDADVCLAAVRQNGGALEYVPEELKTKDICTEAVRAPLGKYNSSPLCYVPESLKTPEICTLAVQKRRDAFRYVPSEFRNEVRRLLAEGVKPSASDSESASADPLERACAAFASGAKGFSLPPGCSLQFEAKNLDDGCIRVCISVSDPQENGWPAGSAPSASAVYRSGAGGAADPAACLRAFAEKLEGKAGKPIETMPKGMKDFCAGAVRAAAEAAAACSAVLEKEEAAEGFSPAQ